MDKAALTIPVCEIFHSLQGEGSWSGFPSVFVRLAGCNLRCTWCDTPYALDLQEATRMAPEAIAEQVDRYPATSHVVLTGGEPMIYTASATLVQLLKLRGRTVTVETNGTVPPGQLRCDLASISPKLSNSGTGKCAFSSEAIAVVRSWIDSLNCQFKFVVSNAAEVDEVLDYLRILDRVLPPEMVFLMPEGRDPQTIADRSQRLSEICLETGFRYGRRLQLDLYGDRRGT